MKTEVLVAGGGIGGLACALGLGLRGVQVALLEQSRALVELGAGLQLGPNAVRVLDAWGLMTALREVAAFPEALHVRDALSGQQRAVLRLGPRAEQRYGQPYACLHRADLHQLLLHAVQTRTATTLQLGARVTHVHSDNQGVNVALDDGSALQAHALMGCDGLWSRVRYECFDQEPPRRTGHLAYRALVPLAAMPAAHRAQRVAVWLGPRLHVVHYPVRGGEWVNLVVVVHEDPARRASDSDAHRWTLPATREQLAKAMGSVCSDLMGVLDAAPTWTRWVLHDRPALSDAQQQAQGRVALLGDAAHPMRPYLAQGAAMAIEDAWTLHRLLGGTVGPIDWAGTFISYARARWPRNARVQRRSLRNGSIFHAQGLLRLGRDAAMTLLGERLLDNPWLYAGPPDRTQTR